MAGEPAKSRAVQVGEFYELEVGADLAASPRFNEDIAPTRVAQRTWNTWHIAALWVGMAICVPTYTLGGVLTTYFGLSVGEALWAVFIANVIVLIPLILNAFGGTKFGIPFPVMLRSAFGIIGSNVPALIRALVACGWFGIQTLFGGIAVHLLLSALSDGWARLGGVGEVLGFFIFFYLPLLLTDLTGVKDGFRYNLIDGAIRLVFFLIYIVAIGCWGEMRRVFQYHGAEHKTIHNLESGEELTPENAGRQSRFHPRCGTSFLFLVVIVSFIVFTFTGRPETWEARLFRFALIPVIAGVSFEIIRFAGAHYDKPWVRWMSAPGLELQRLTTREPSRDMLEVAIAALRAVL